MRLVGLTGGIGSGKSTVAARLRALGAAVIDADQLAREVVAPGTPGLAEVAARFGPGVLGPDGALDRKKVAALVFADATKRAELEAIIHPRVAALAQARFAEAAASGARLCVYDVPLLFENGLDRLLPEVVVVKVSPAVQRARIAARDGLSAPEIEQRIAAQLPLEAKAARARHVIDNDGSMEATRAQVDHLYAQLVEGDS